MDDLKFLVVVILACIVLSLGSGLFHMTSGPGASDRVLRALTLRISLSVVLFVLLMAGWYAGVITPNHAGP